ncbi:MAG: ABC transporter substrate-binding protein, partial [Desulfobacula sp.]|nr:ABC transporter substrate-binding protein [Desulfobacula sp.]
MSIDTGMTILVVDDSGTMRLMFKGMLQDVGFENILLAKDGKEAIERLPKQKVDLVISDWNMPNMDGLALLKWIRSSEEYKDLLFIMATAQGDKSQEEVIKNEKGNGHIAKPFDAAQLKEKIEEVFGLKKEDVLEEVSHKVVNGKVQMKLGHIQITDHLILGVLKYQIEKGDVTPKYFDLETKCMPGWNPVQQSLEKGTIDGAFILAPIAMDLFAFNTPIKLVSLAHKNGSSFVRNKSYSANSYDSLASFYKYKVVQIPHKMSVHNMLAHKFLKEMGLQPGVPGEKAINVRFEVVPPVKMPEIMKVNDNVAGFVVAEPIASNAIAKNIADLEFISASRWQNHPCCVVAMRDEFISKYSDAVYELVSLLVEAGKFVEKNKDKASEIAVAFLDPEKGLGLTQDV